MRKIIGFIGLLMLAYACGNDTKTGTQRSGKAAADSAKGPILPDSMVVYDWNKDGINDTFILHPAPPDLSAAEIRMERARHL